MFAIRSVLRTISLTLVVCAAPLAPAIAQNSLCNGLGDGAPWMGQTQDRSDIATQGAPLVWAGDVASGGRGIALFTLSAPMAVRVEAMADTPMGDVMVELFDATGRLVVVDDDSGGNLSARAEPDLEAGDYCVAITGFGGAAVAGRIQVSRLEMLALTPGLAGGFAGMDAMIPFVGMEPCLPETPAMRLGDGSVDAQLMDGLVATGSAAQTPYFRFALASPQPLSIRASNEDADPYLYLFDATGQLLGENDDADGLNSRLDFSQALPEGEYCIGLRALGDPMLPIEVQIIAHDGRAATFDGYAQGMIAPPLDGSWPVQDLGVLPAEVTRDWPVSGGLAQWFVMEVPADGLLMITADAIDDSDPVISLFDSAGTMLGQNDDANDSVNSQLVQAVAPGRYVLAVRQFVNTHNGMIRVGVARYVRAAP